MNSPIGYAGKGNSKLSVIDVIKQGVGQRLLVAVVLIVHSLSAAAMPKFARQYKLEYGYTPSCQACHREGGGTPLNGYGQAFMDGGENSAAFGLIATADSDNDGFTNAQEAAAKANPGDKKSIPGTTGMWLDLSSLIPREVQALFPEATAWKPLDAILTPQDIAAAHNMGVSLTAEDENTIYIPVAERRPIGTALIFPAIYQDETYFMVMATDRQLNISQISFLKSAEQPAENVGNIVAELLGTPVQSVPLPATDGLDASIQLAVKRAGVLVYLRLKGA